MTQAVESPFLGGRTLGLAKIRNDLNVPGTSIEAVIGGDVVHGLVVTHPLYEKERKRAKAG